MKQIWKGLQHVIDQQRFEQVQMLLNIQEKEAVMVAQCLYTVFPDLFPDADTCRV
jgi:hypothetical protein